MRLSKKEVSFTQEGLKGMLDYSSSIGEFVWLERKQGRRFGQVAGHLDKTSGYIRIWIDGERYQASHLAWLYIYGYFPDGEKPFIDHINGKRDDNRIENLKVCSGTDNNRNVQMGSRNTSGTTGVCRKGIWNGSKTKKNWYWIAFWQDENMKRKEKKFNIESYGEEKSRQMAIVYREGQIQKLKSEGIYYSDRHGKGEGVNYETKEKQND